MSRKLGAIALIMVAVTFALLAWHARGGGATGSDSNDEGQLQELIHQWDEAYARRDGPALARLLADEFTFTTPTGAVINRAQYLSANLKAPDIAVETPIGSDDIKVRTYGSVAVVSSRAAQRGQRFDRDPKVRFRYTDVLVKRQGRWQAVASQATRVTMP